MKSRNQQEIRGRIDDIALSLDNNQLDELYQTARVAPLVEPFQVKHPFLYQKAIALLGEGNEELLTDIVACKQLEAHWRSRVRIEQTLPRLWIKKKTDAEEEIIPMITDKDIASIRLLIVSAGHSCVVPGKGEESAYKKPYKYDKYISFFKNGMLENFASMEVNTNGERLAILDTRGDISDLLALLERAGFEPL